MWRNYTIIYRNFSKNNKQLLEYKKCYQILGIPENSDQEQIRLAYIKLVKIYHPDSETGDIKRFYEIDTAFKILINKKSRERWQVDEDEETSETQSIKHKTPQHRQYLNYGGYGYGTPFEREKQYQAMRAMQATDNVYQHRVAKITAEENALLDKNQTVRHNIKTKYGFDRLVEDLIQESMSKGEFNNLKGIGKPLKNQPHNPYVDFITHKLNQVLIDNGFTPEWIMLAKEIRENIEKFREDLMNERIHLGPYPLNNNDQIEWENILEKMRENFEKINKKIDHYNLVVPLLNKQMLHIDLKKESDKIIKNNTQYNIKKSTYNNIDKKNNNSFINIWNIIKF